MSFGARFLRHPGRFPERPRGDAWGGRELRLELPGGPYQLLGLSAGQEEGVLATFPAARGRVPRPAATAPLAAEPAGAEPGSAVPVLATGAAGSAPIPIRLLRCAPDEFLPVDVR